MPRVSMATQGATFDAMRLFQKYHFPLCKADVTGHDSARRLLTHLERSIRLRDNSRACHFGFHSRVSFADRASCTGIIVAARAS